MGRLGVMKLRFPTVSRSSDLVCTACQDLSLGLPQAHLQFNCLRTVAGEDPLAPFFLDCCSDRSSILDGSATVLRHVCLKFESCSMWLCYVILSWSVTFEFS